MTVGLLITSAILFSSINDFYSASTTNTRPGEYVDKRRITPNTGSPINKTNQNVGNSFSFKTTESHPLDAIGRPRRPTARPTDQTTTFRTSQTTTQPNRGYNSYGWNRPSGHHHDSRQDDSIVFDIRTAAKPFRPRTNSAETEQSNVHSIAKRSSNDRPRGTGKTDLTQQTTQNPIVGSTDEKLRSERDESCQIDMFWGVSIAAMVMATLQLLCTTVCFTITTEVS